MVVPQAVIGEMIYRKARWADRAAYVAAAAGRRLIRRFRQTRTRSLRGREAKLAIGHSVWPLRLEGSELYAVLESIEPFRAWGEESGGSEERVGVNECLLGAE